MNQAPISAKQLRAMLRAGNYEQALPVLDQRIRENPDDAPAHWHRASCLEAFDRLEETLAAVRRVLQIDPRLARAWLKQAELAITLDENYPDYEANLRQAIAVDPGYVEGHQALADFLQAANRSAEAQQELVQAISLEPSHEPGRDASPQLASDDPLDLLAANTAKQLFQVGNEALPIYVECDPQDYPQYQRAYAQQALQIMTQAGFTLLGDYEPLHLREAQSQPTLVRLYTGDQGAIVGVSYRMAPKRSGKIGFLRAVLGGRRNKPAVIELLTAFGNGQFIVTQNSVDPQVFAYGSTVAIEQLPTGAKLEAVLKRHRARVAEYMGIHRKVQTQQATTLDEISLLLARLTETKNQFRKSIGYVSDIELRKLLGAQYEALANRVRQHLARLTDTP